MVRTIDIYLFWLYQGMKIGSFLFNQKSKLAIAIGMRGSLQRKIGMRGEYSFLFASQFSNDLSSAQQYITIQQTN
jgi:hypothetical protein